MFWFKHLNLDLNFYNQLRMASVMLEGDLDQLSLHSILWGVVKFKKLQYCTLQQRERARGGMLKLAQILTSGA